MHRHLIALALATTALISAPVLDTSAAPSAAAAECCEPCPVGPVCPDPCTDSCTLPCIDGAQSGFIG